MRASVRAECVGASQDSPDVVTCSIGLFGPSSKVRCANLPFPSRRFKRPNRALASGSRRGVREEAGGGKRIPEQRGGV